MGKFYPIRRLLGKQFSAEFGRRWRAKSCRIYGRFWMVLKRAGKLLNRALASCDSRNVSGKAGCLILHAGVSLKVGQRIKNR